MSNLEGLYRIASFVGLGLCLVGIGWLYQRFVHRPRETRAMTLSTAVSKIGGRFGKRRFLMVLATFYALVWLWSAIAPAYRFDWFLENMLPTAIVAVLIASFRRLPLSDVSYAMLFLFLCLHQMGAHYQYSDVPLGWWLKDLFGFERNHFDRIVHFSFGFLLSIRCARSHPLRDAEQFLCRPLRACPRHGGLRQYFEIIEMAVALIVSPEAGDAYLGARRHLGSTRRTCCRR